MSSGGGRARARSHHHVLKADGGEREEKKANAAAPGARAGRATRALMANRSSAPAAPRAPRQWAPRGGGGAFWSRSLLCSRRSLLLTLLAADRNSASSRRPMNSGSRSLHCDPGLRCWNIRVLWCGGGEGGKGWAFSLCSRSTRVRALARASRSQPGDAHDVLHLLPEHGHPLLLLPRRHHARRGRAEGARGRGGEWFSVAAGSSRLFKAGLPPCVGECCRRGNGMMLMKGGLHSRVCLRGGAAARRSCERERRGRERERLDVLAAPPSS